MTMSSSPSPPLLPVKLIGTDDKTENKLFAFPLKRQKKNTRGTICIHRLCRRCLLCLFHDCQHHKARAEPLKFQNFSPRNATATVLATNDSSHCFLCSAPDLFKIISCIVGVISRIITPNHRSAKILSDAGGDQPSGF